MRLFRPTRFWPTVMSVVAIGMFRSVVLGSDIVDLPPERGATHSLSPDLHAAPQIAGEDAAVRIDPALLPEPGVAIPYEVLLPGSPTYRAAFAYENSPGKIYGRYHLAYRFDTRTGEIDPIGFERSLTASAAEAIARSPLWLRDQLADKLLDLNDNDQNDLADLILNPLDDRYIDEIAFLAAFLPYSTLASGAFEPEILVENAAAIYSHDMDLDYVEVVDYGIPGVDEDYYTTARYKALSNGDPVTLEIPMEVYYWFVVMPRCDSERLDYIKPKTGGGGADGHFWRTYFFSPPDDDSSYVKHFLMKSPTLIDPAELNGWGWSAQGYFTDMERHNLELVLHGETGEPCFIELSIGKGTIIATTMPLESAYHAGSSVLLANALAYGNGDMQLAAGDPVALFKDVDPFGHATNEEVLADQGRSYDVLGSADMGTVDLSIYKKVIFASGQPLSFYEALSTNRDDFQSWVSNGGVLELHGATSAPEDWAGLVMPGGFTCAPQAYHFTDTVEVLGHPILSEVLEGIEYLWDGVRYDSISGDRPFEGTTFAIDAVCNWVGKNMLDNVQERYETHGSYERSIQPVRIAYNHYGNCGELQDILGAALKSALIPNWGISDINEDHVWNEFWYDGEFHYLQNDWSNGVTRIDTPGGGQDEDYGGGKTVSFIIGWKGDGCTVNEIERYSNNTTLTVSVTDAGGVPLEGAQILLATQGWGTSSLYVGLCAFTDADGRATIPLGDQRDYYIRLETPLGDYPAEGGITKVIDASESLPGTVFEWSHAYDVPILDFTVTPASPAPEPVSYALSVGLDVVGSIQYGTSYFTGEDYNIRFGPGDIDVYVTDYDNYRRFLDLEDFDAVDVFEETWALGSLYLPPAQGEWYIILSNLRGISCYQTISLSLEEALQDDDIDGDGSSILDDPADCDDNNPMVHPGAAEICDGRDSDCDGTVPPEEADEDGDGFPLCWPDCDDTDPQVSPGHREVPGDGIDNDCDGAIDEPCFLGAVGIRQVALD